MPGSNTSGPATSRARSTATTPRSATTTPSPTARLFCGGTVGFGGGVGLTHQDRGTCDFGFKFWTVGTHHDWFPLPGLRFAVDVMYTALDSNMSGETITINRTQGARVPGVYTIKDLGIVSTIFRAQRTWGAD